MAIACLNRDMTKKDILDNAITIIAEDGFEALTLQRLAESLNIRKPSLYYHFESKEAIIEALYEHFRAEIRKLGFSLDFKAEALDILKTTFFHYNAIFSDPELSKYISFIDQRRDIDEEAYEISESLSLMIQAQSSAVIENLIERGKLHFADKPLLATLFSSELQMRLRNGAEDEENENFLISFVKSFS